MKDASNEGIKLPFIPILMKGVENYKEEGYWKSFCTEHFQTIRGF